MDAAMTVERIPIKSIFSRAERRLRRLNPDHVKRLADSIAEIGLQSPISLRAIPCPPDTAWSHDGKHYHITAGEHRFEACCSLGWTEIPAIILDLSDLDRELWEIDENLMRAELTKIERAEHLRQRKILYELKHPETRQHVAGGRKRSAAANFAVAEQAPSFVQDTAEKAGMCERAIRQSVHWADAITPAAKEAIRDMPAIADSGVELDALAAVEPKHQEAVVESVRTGKARNVREAAESTKPARKTKRRDKRSDEEVLRRRVEAAIKQYQKKAGHRLAALQVRCAEGGVQVEITYADDGTQQAA